MKSVIPLVIVFIMGMSVGLGIREYLSSKSCPEYEYRSDQFIAKLSGTRGGGINYIRTGFTLYACEDVENLIKNGKKEEFISIINGLIRSLTPITAGHTALNSDPLRDEIIEVLRKKFPEWEVYDLRFHSLSIQ